MAKFKVNQRVMREYDGKIGVVKAREVVPCGNFTKVKYLVDFGEGIENWKVVTKAEISNVPDMAIGRLYNTKVYKMDDGKEVVLAASVEVTKPYVIDYFENKFRIKEKKLCIGFSIYNGTDEYNPELGKKIAIHRSKKNPFTTMVSNFTGEFNAETVEAIMDVKANYIIENIDKFYRPQ